MIAMIVMTNLVEEPSFRNMLHVFRDRRDAGKRLASKLSSYKGKECMVLGIPSGGVPVSLEVARRLRAEHDVIIVKKIQLPCNTGAGFGAVGPGGDVFLNEFLLDHMNLTRKEIEDEIGKAMATIRSRERLLRGNRPFPSLRDRTVIVADDGLASGYTMLSAIEFLKRCSPARIIVAVPTASLRVVELISPRVNELVCLNVRTGPFFTVADAYRRWRVFVDDEVLGMLEDFRKERMR